MLFWKNKLDDLGYVLESFLDFGFILMDIIIYRDIYMDKLL